MLTAYLDLFEYISEPYFSKNLLTKLAKKLKKRHCSELQNLGLIDNI